MLRIISLLIRLFIHSGRSGHSLRINDNFQNLSLHKADKRSRRVNALKAAKAYLKPYKDIFGDFCLSNKFCMVNYISGTKVFAMSNIADEEGKKSICTAEKFAIIELDDFWDRICMEFDHQTSYNDILRQCSLSAIEIKESFMQAGVRKNNKIEEKIIKSEELIDINNCSEAELTALPGISAVISKKIIKFREETREFKSFDDFIAEMAIKEHFAEQLKTKIVVNKKIVEPIKKIQDERIIDI